MSHDHRDPSPATDPPRSSLSRQQFLRLASGEVAGLGIPGVHRGEGGRTSNGSAAALDERVPRQGIHGMVRARGWIEAHCAAAVLAGYYSFRDGSLDEPIVAGVRLQLDALIESRGAPL